MVVLFKNESPLEEVSLELPVFPDGTFHLRSVMTGQALGVRTGGQFRHGIKIHLPREFKVEIVEIRK